MERMAMEQLQRWKDKKNRRPLVVRGAPRVGKTWLLKTFAETAYEEAVYIDFSGNERMTTLFADNPPVERLMMGLSLFCGHKFDPEKTLLIFDEVQEVPGAPESLRVFYEDAPAVQIACACSRWDSKKPGVGLFPRGKVEFLDLHPLSLQEFLGALGRERELDLLREGDFDAASELRREYEEILKQYCFTGGMPEVVQCFAAERDFNQARELQRRILAGYEQYISEYAPAAETARIREVWRSLPAQLDREGKKFTYSLLREGARSKEYENALRWLSAGGLVQKVPRVGAPVQPLAVHQDPKAFKLYPLDVGLLACMFGLRQEILLDRNEIFKAFSGALTEQYVMQQLKTIRGLELCYWTAGRGTAELSFLTGNGSEVIPVEDMAEKNLQAKSMKVYRERYHPRRAIRTSLSGFGEEDGLLDMPLWAISS